MGMLDDFSLELTCPECGKKTEQKVSRLKGDSTFTFPCCGLTCETKQFADGIAAAEEALNRFGRDFGNMGKKF